MNFKIGDRVTRKAEHGQNCGFKPGDIGTVVGPIGKWVGVRSDNGFSVALHNARYLQIVEIPDTITVEQALAFLKTKGEVKFEPKFEPVRVYLNSTYDAIIYKDYVEVGCQKFPHNAVLRLFQAVNKVRNGK